MTDILNETWGWLTDRPGLPLARMLTEDGTPTGNCSMTGDYSVTPKDFYIQPEEGIVFLVLGLKVNLTLKPAPDKNDYGEIVGGITNGIELLYQRGVYERQILPLGPVKNNGGWILANAIRENPMLDGSAEINVFAFNHLETFGQALPLWGNQNDRLIARLNDDFSMQTVHCMTINGIRRAIYRDQQL